MRPADEMSAAGDVVAVACDLRSVSLELAAHRRDVTTLPVDRVRKLALDALRCEQALNRVVRGARPVHVVDALTAGADTETVAHLVGGDLDTLWRVVTDWVADQRAQGLITPDRRAEILRLVSGSSSNEFPEYLLHYTDCLQEVGFLARWAAHVITAVEAELPGPELQAKLVTLIGVVSRRPSVVRAQARSRAR